MTGQVVGTLRRAVLVTVLAVVGARYGRAWLAAASTPPMNPRRPPGAIEYVEVGNGTTIALFDNRLEVRGPTMGALGFQRIYLDDIRDVVGTDRAVDVATDDGVLAIPIESRLTSALLKASIDKARARLASR